MFDSRCLRILPWRASYLGAQPFSSGKKWGAGGGPTPTRVTARTRGTTAGQGRGDPAPQSPPFLQDTLPRSLGESFLAAVGKGSLGKGSTPANQHSHQAGCSLGDGSAPLLPDSTGPTRWPVSYVGQSGGLPGDGQTPETDRFLAYGQSPWRQALTRWPRSCPCPSPRSSGRGQPSLQAAPRHSNNNPPGS